MKIIKEYSEKRNENSLQVKEKEAIKIHMEKQWEDQLSFANWGIIFHLYPS